MELVMEIIFIGLIVGGVAGTIRHLWLANRERKARAVELERQRMEWVAKANRNFADRQAKTAASRAGKRNQ
jgi:hypothetical protein